MNQTMLAIRHAAVALGVASEAPLVKVEVTGSKGAFRTMLVKELMGLNQGTTNPPGMRFGC